MDRGNWWVGATGYQIYIRSFCDRTGDGVGDLAGIEANLEYLAWLGVDAVWITPFYPSPGFDHGYDVSHYRDVDPAFGSLDDFDRVVKEANRLGLRVMVDIVPNHTSHLHPWFVEARASRDSARREYYVWRDPAPGGGPPNNWVSHFGGPAWTLDPTTGQYYLHLFLPEQPDLNWRCPAVADEFDRILEFWCDRGVDGFRIDVAHGLRKAAHLDDNPVRDDLGPDMGPTQVFEAHDHLHDLDQPDVLEIYRRWRSVVEPYGAVLAGELDLPSAAVVRYVAEGDALDLAFYLRPSMMAWDPVEATETILGMHEGAPGRIAWLLSSHDRPRVVTRFGGGERGRRRALAASTLVLALGGMAFVYQGEELGLDDGEVVGPAEDPIAARNPTATVNRDGCRTPMPWDSSLWNGFSSAERVWLPARQRAPEESVEWQRHNQGSTVHQYRRLIGSRRRHPELRAVPDRIDRIGRSAVVVWRDGAAVAVNLGPDAVDTDLPTGWTVDFATDRRIAAESTWAQGHLGPEQAVVLVAARGT